MRTAAAGRVFAAAGWLLGAALPLAAPARCAEMPAPPLGAETPAAATPAPSAPTGSIEDLWIRGEAALKAGALDEALRLFSAALSADERRGRSWNYLGGVHFAQGDLQRALQDFRRALELEPRDVRAWNNLGTTFERLGNYKAARESYEWATQIDPAYPLTQRNLGILQARRLGNPEAARLAWQRYLALAPAGAYADEVRRELATLDAQPQSATPEPAAR